MLLAFPKDSKGINIKEFSSLFTKTTLKERSFMSPVLSSR